MIPLLEAAIASLREVAAIAGSEGVGDDIDALRIVDLASDAERLAQGLRTIAMTRVISSGAWAASGVHRTPAEWLASRARGTVRAAIDQVETASRLDALPATRRALAEGSLSAVQAAQITEAATADPSAETTLLSLATHAPYRALRERCADVIAAATDDEDRDERIHRNRYLRRRLGNDGAVMLEARMAAVPAATLWSVLHARADELQTAARKSGIREPFQAHLADALVELAAGPSGRRASIAIVVDQAALARGHTIPGETCKVVGTGPITVSTAARMIAESAVTALAKNGADVTKVASMTRHIPAAVKKALLVRDPTCVVPGCGATAFLEADHIEEFSKSKLTRLEDLGLLCRFHHLMKTLQGWMLGGGPGRWTWTPPPEPP